MEVSLRTVVVTGVSSGVGRNLARHLVNKGATVIGLARRENLLQELSAELSNSPGKFFPKVVDILKEEDVSGLFSWAEENNKKIDVLINNAGVFNFATLTDGKSEDWKVIIDTQLMGTSIVTREAVRHMKKLKLSDCVIINIQSVNAKVVAPMGSYMYTACEHALDVLSTGLRLEILQQGLPIRVSKICPGLIKTEKVQKNSDLNNLPALEMEDIANTVSYILETPKHIEINDITLRPIGSIF